MGGGGKLGLPIHSYLDTRIMGHLKKLKGDRFKAVRQKFSFYTTNN